MSLLVEMAPPAQQHADPTTLLKLSSLISTTTASLISALSGSTTTDSVIPSTQIYNLQQTLISATAMLSSLISDPRVRLIEISAQFTESRALHIVVEKRIPDLLAKSGESGVHITAIGKSVGIEALKLGK
jgi:hypothetical protein